ncbi:MULTISPECIES: FAD-binding oxidoreductase [unclassified Mesorhizobium]|uniref:NAD(P)/FAD-dependent oxidoreductase n=3 Tax=Mesorhizobium TaxID=68287 RepID=UPI000F755B17|nr:MULTISPECIES: FAD-binding oxidoreductase [unclassified Mesorhizobium]AZO02875.1 FAD-dependent oxidoreductase [Mesorhizobium sp. M2A.F.Ca.ET.043.02.1.1]RUW41091.1 FAD-dependent oxidoreductase [Mesorhizobium sp. M2A.F.Ca.ET.015.02.1.1]RVC97534.1 FAD-dependent oxidoreductase [Mesorhizobium sp. M2A.F.Ca.ET.017.03.2.1]RVD05792.1 FAD-dependent oxidoreductase [Mesorhizobium sp. M2A.F.Ca.ET.029.05.1.1]RWB43434.1 MAG: FAD-dependent oxidoreductase [Mesorhizobium sp.]
MQVKRNGDISFWYADLGGIPAPCPPLPGDIEADVAIVGAGYTGLWTAYYLKKAKPSLRIVLVEREFAGFGASGRNGGWLSGGFGWSREKYLKTSTRPGVTAMQQAMAGCVDEVIRVATEEGIDADIRRVDNLTVATNPAQLERVREECETTRSWDADPERIELLDAEATRARINIRNVMGGFVIRGQARVQPAKLVRGLAAAVERLGVSIYEKTTVTAIAKGIVATDRGTVRAETIIRATEGFTAGIPGEERTWLALNSAQIVTEPLPEELWHKIGWQGHELLGNAAHAYCYAQRTREGRITMGGRGVPYRYGSRTDINGQTQQATIDQLHTILTTLLPQTAGCRIDHAWCGVLGVPRDWCTTVGLDPATRIGWAGGYVGLGVSSSNLSGRTLTDLVLGQDTELTRLPWVNRKVRPWEPEPFRWLGVHSMYQLYRIADQREAAGLGHTSRLAALADSITGH